MLTTHTLNTLKGFLSFKRGCFLFVFLNHVIGKTENQILHKLVRFCTSPPTTTHVHTYSLQADDCKCTKITCT